MTRWIVSRRRRPDAAAVLYCFPHAGGLPGEYVRFSDDLPEFDVRGVHLPGRTTRRTEAPYTSMDVLVDALVATVEFEDSGETARPFVFFGHSLGALVAFEVARALSALGRTLPKRLILSSCPAPPRPPATMRVSSLDDGELLDAIERGTGESLRHLREDSALREHAVASFRADYALLEHYAPRSIDPVACPITVLTGNQEPSAPGGPGWPEYSTGATRLAVAPGGHFYFRTGPGREYLLDTFRESVPVTTGDRK